MEPDPDFWPTNLKNSIILKFLEHHVPVSSGQSANPVTFGTTVSLLTYSKNLTAQRTENMNNNLYLDRELLKPLWEYYATHFYTFRLVLYRFIVTLPEVSRILQSQVMPKINS